MKRRRRQRAILDIVGERPVQNQADLVDELARRGLPATQATVSRDVRQLGLLKRPMPGGGARYVAPEDVPAHGEQGAAAQLEVCRQFLTEVAEVRALLALKTGAGRANAVAVAIDQSRLPEVCGTLAGDDTILVLLRRDRDQEAVAKLFRGLIAGD